MNKANIAEMAKKAYSTRAKQGAYILGFKAACNIVRLKLNTCYNLEFCEQMERLSEIAFVDFDDHLGDTFQLNDEK